MLDKIILYCFYTLFFLTPLFWTSLNYELFEYNKMILVYGLTVIIVGAWLLKIINLKSLIFNRTPLDIPLLLFLGANILSTIFSIDPHTSIWGYYSRLNGGLLSTISYLILYWAAVSNLQPVQTLKLLKVGIISGVIISFWSILEHFGVSPSCIILRGELNANCWVQDVQARVFATLGQPNWLAAYLAMLIFPALYFLLTASTKRSLTTYYILLTTYYLAFTFTYSRGATLGLLAGFFVFFSPIFLSLHLKSINLNLKPFLGIIGLFLTINLIFGSAFTRFQFSQLLPKSPPTSTQPDKPTAVTQLEAGGTESGQIRLIVWRGALDIFKAYPIFGSGVETFAYSYYQFRPVAHNLVSEWDFLYNKAHNEFLNYLATAGIVGFATYMLVILTFIVWSMGIIFNKNFKFQISNFKNNSTQVLLIAAVLASYISYLVQNFFGFSVVIIALFFYLFPALAFVATATTKPITFNPKFLILNSIYRRPIYTKVTKVIIVIFTLYFLFSILKLWYADILFAKGERFLELGNPGRAYNFLTKAVALNPNEPFYHSELGFAASQASVALLETDATLSARLKDQAITETDLILRTSPKNVTFLRTAVRTYFELSGAYPTFTQKAIEALDQAIKMAPTDAKLYYNKAVILGQMNEQEEAIKILQKALELKPNYRDATYSLGLFYFDKDDKQKAVEMMNKVLQIVPNDPEALEKLKEWGVK